MGYNNCQKLRTYFSYSFSIFEFSDTNSHLEHLNRSCEPYSMSAVAYGVPVILKTRDQLPSIKHMDNDLPEGSGSSNLGLIPPPCFTKLAFIFFRGDIKIVRLSFINNFMVFNQKLCWAKGCILITNAYFAPPPLLELYLCPY